MGLARNIKVLNQSWAIVQGALLALIILAPAQAQLPVSLTPSRSVLSVLPSKIYAGAYVDFGEREDTVTRAALLHYDRLIGKKSAIIGFSSDWGNLSFPAKQLQIISDYGAVALVYWSPWDRPLGAPQARNRFSLKKILAGEWDEYIAMWAKEARRFKKPLLVAWGLEMNGEWFPWSGAFYGAGAPAASDNSPAYEGPETFKKAYRYVVDRVREQGAFNIAWVFHANNTSDPNEPWNSMENYYPGHEYVDWLGMSAYGQQYPDQRWASFDIVFPEPCKRLASLAPDKPVILAEWGIGEFPYSGNKAAWLEEAFQRLPKECPGLKAAVYWHERWKNGDGTYSNLRVNSSPAALAVFRRAIADSLWMERPVIREEPTP